MHISYTAPPPPPCGVKSAAYPYRKLFLKGSRPQRIKVLNISLIVHNFYNGFEASFNHIIYHHSYD